MSQFLNAANDFHFIKRTMRAQTGLQPACDLGKTAHGGA